MMPPRRSRKNLDLPKNLYTNGKYFYYKNPATGKKISLNCSRSEAIGLAIEANQAIKQAPRLILRDDNIPALLERFEREYVTEKAYAASTLAEIRIKLKAYRAEFGGNLRELDVKTFAAWLDKHERAAYIKHRALWCNIYRFAISKGLTQFNAAEATLPKRQAPRRRDRLSLDGYKKIYDKAAPWFQIAMDAALYTLQRRGDLVRIRLDDFQDDTLPIIQQKTETALRIKANDGLRGVFRRSQWSGITSPYLIHKKPLRVSEAVRRRREHHTQVTPEMLSREFARLRKGMDTTATFHEIRSLGGRLLIEQGYSQGFVQVLMGHASEAMTEHYLEDGKIEWVQAEAGLKL